MTTNCFAINQKLIDASEQYDAMKKKLQETAIYINSEQSVLRSWEKDFTEESNKNYISQADSMLSFYQVRIEETKIRINDLKLQYSQTEELVKKLEPLKNEYDKQAQREFERKKFIDSSLRLGGHLLIFSIFILGAWFIIHQRRKHWRLLKEGKITQQQYDEMTSSSSSPFSNMGVNPSTGLPMCGVGISDASGTPRGGTPTSSYSSSYRSDDTHRSMLDR